MPGGFAGKPVRDPPGNCTAIEAPLCASILDRARIERAAADARREGAPRREGFMITGVQHIGLAVNSIDETMRRWRARYGAEELGRKAFPEIGQTSALVRLGYSYFELMEALGEEGVIPSFLKKRGEGFHHISFHSDCLEEDVRRLEKDGVSILGKGGSTVFTHPKTTDGLVLEITEEEEQAGAVSK
jgi:methylmalonyl-CoA epimerase